MITFVENPESGAVVAFRREESSHGNVVVQVMLFTPDQNVQHDEPFESISIPLSDFARLSLGLVR